MAAEETATLANGCFWCTEAAYLLIPGVRKVVSGYAGGSVPHPTYEQVCAGTTGHAECVQLTFDPATVRYEELLEVFFASHDPTTLNRQGADVGTQYRSAIFTHNDVQRVIAGQVKARAQADVADPIVTEIVPLDEFYPAEAYHEDYYARHSFQPYCMVVIRPKLEKLKKRLKERAGSEKR
jgi:peptide-methionine (S)-S-oxide reductase